MPISLKMGVLKSRFDLGHTFQCAVINVGVRSIQFEIMLNRIRLRPKG